MSDLTDDELAMACGFVGSSPDTTVEFDDMFWRLVEEIRRHRTAQTASAEQVRSVVHAAVRELAGIGQWPPPNELCAAIADRVASQLAAPAALDSERVRSVVREAVMLALGDDQDGPFAKALAVQASKDIADRVASQLATHVNSVTVIGRDNTTVVLTIQMPSCQLSKEHVEVVALAAADGVRSRLGARS